MTEDVCGNCGGRHRSGGCNSREVFCASCKNNTHASWNRNCPTFKKACEDYNQRMEENNLRHYPTKEHWTPGLNTNQTWNLSEALNTATICSRASTPEDANSWNSPNEGPADWEEMYQETLRAAKEKSLRKGKKRRVTFDDNESEGDSHTENITELTTPLQQPEQTRQSLCQTILPFATASLSQNADSTGPSQSTHTASPARTQPSSSQSTNDREGRNQQTPNTLNE